MRAIVIGHYTISAFEAAGVSQCSFQPGSHRTQESIECMACHEIEGN